jgi:hypothetical protein
VCSIRVVTSPSHCGRRCRILHARGVSVLNVQGKKISLTGLLNLPLVLVCGILSSCVGFLTVKKRVRIKLLCEVCSFAGCSDREKEGWLWC